VFHIFLWKLNDIRNKAFYEIIILFVKILNQKKSKNRMRKIYHLSSCSTCQRIIKELGGLEDFEMQNIKEEKIKAKQIDEMKKMAGSYEALFSRRSMKYRPMGLHEKEISEKEYRKLILEEYTFLKRPVIIIDDEIFVGNAKKVVAAAKEKIGL
jgi:arsenate reductase